MVPVLPLREIDVPEPEHTVAFVAVAVPPTEVAETVTVTSLDVLKEQAPLVTFALNFVVCVRLPVDRDVPVSPLISTQLLPL